MSSSIEPISKKLIRLRKERNLSIRETARLIDVPETTYREWEYGRSIRGEPYLKIAKAFGVSLNELLGDSRSTQDSHELDFDKIIKALEKLKLKISDS